MALVFVSRRDNHPTVATANLHPVIQIAALHVGQIACITQAHAPKLTAGGLGPVNRDLYRSFATPTES